MTDQKFKKIFSPRVLPGDALSAGGESRLFVGLLVCLSGFWDRYGELLVACYCMNSLEVRL